LDEIAEFIAKDSVHYAEITVTGLFSSTSILKSFPLSGRVVPEFELEHIREIIKGAYRVVYQLTEEEVIEVLSVGTAWVKTDEKSIIPMTHLSKMRTRS
jgi:toxin ParE1/3/4